MLESNVSEVRSVNRSKCWEWVGVGTAWSAPASISQRSVPSLSFHLLMREKQLRRRVILAPDRYPTERSWLGAGGDKRNNFIFQTYSSDSLVSELSKLVSRRTAFKIMEDCQIFSRHDRRIISTLHFPLIKCGISDFLPSVFSLQKYFIRHPLMFLVLHWNWILDFRW